MGKRAGSTAAGDRQHQTIVVGSNNQVGGGKMSHLSTHNANANNSGGTTDYSYNIGPTSQYKQSAAPRNGTKFSDLKFHHTALDFNKNAANNPANNTQIITSSQKYSTAGKKGNNSIDLGSKAAAQNITHTVMNVK